ncbi:MAG: hypothetical protein CM1200mV1_440 [uncultured marine virus]|nr:MAG: hypothetical protein CM1200mV1_440 [uncultured marine virus]
MVDFKKINLRKFKVSDSKGFKLSGNRKLMKLKDWGNPDLLEEQW